MDQHSPPRPSGNPGTAPQGGQGPIRIWRCPMRSGPDLRPQGRFDLRASQTLRPVVYRRLCRESGFATGWLFAPEKRSDQRRVSRQSFPWNGPFQIPKARRTPPARAELGRGWARFVMIRRCRPGPGVRFGRREPQSAPKRRRTRIRASGVTVGGETRNSQHQLRTGPFPCFSGGTLAGCPCQRRKGNQGSWGFGFAGC